MTAAVTIVQTSTVGKSRCGLGEEPKSLSNFSFMPLSPRRPPAESIFSTLPNCRPTNSPTAKTGILPTTIKGLR